jgi:hypothetical protein
MWHGKPAGMPKRRGRTDRGELSPPVTYADILFSHDRNRGNRICRRSGNVTANDELLLQVRAKLDPGA